METSLSGVLPSQEGQGNTWSEEPNYPKTRADAAGYQVCPIVQEGQGVLLMGEANHVAATTQTDQLLFEPGMLEALSMEAAARLAAPDANNDAMVNFNATKNPMQV